MLSQHLWYKQLGITAEDLESHPNADDLVLLIKWRQHCGELLNNSQQAFYNGVWGMCYKQRYPLKAKHLAKLEDIIRQVETNRHKILYIRQTKTASS